MIDIGFKGGDYIQDIIDGTERKFGSVNAASSTEVAMFGNANLMDYVDNLESQNLSGFDNWSCVTYVVLKSVAAIFNYKIKNKIFSDHKIQWLKDNGYVKQNADGEWRVNFSERFNSVLSGTIPRQGNSGRNVANSVRHDGAIPQEMLDFTRFTTEDEFYNRDSITQEMIDLGLEFASMFDVSYEWYNPNDEEAANYYLQFSLGVWFIACGCPWVENIQQRCLLVANHSVGGREQRIHEDVLGDTYARIQSDGSYKNIRRVAKDFKYHSFGLAMFVTELNNNDDDMIFIQEEGDKNIYLDTGDGTKQMIADMPTKEALEGKRGNGTLVWVDRIID